MIKAAAGDVLVFGLSDRNMELLRQGKPIAVELAELGRPGRVIIFHGPTEEAMEDSLRRAGWIKPRAAAPATAPPEMVKCVDCRALAPKDTHYCGDMYTKLAMRDG